MVFRIFSQDFFVNPQKMNILRKSLTLPQLCRLQSSASATEFVNRNPRNLERMRIAKKPDGYHLDKPGKKFWHKLVITPGTKSVTAEIVHYLNGAVIEAKSSEWAIRKQLYSQTDTCAYIVLGKVLAQRCLEAGINEVYSDIEAAKGGKIERLLNEVVEGGISLEEPDVYSKPHPWDQHRPEKPWEVQE